ncbi:MAG: hypothetical protein J4400_00690 [Candidatus Aenigmarchaeota archaeon]|nr:hypothetical protein [Candidatus Aenigmarchaeota archaeon]
MKITYLKLLSKSSTAFIDAAKRNRKNKNVYNSYVISSMIHSWVLLEAYVNYAADILSVSKIKEHERLLLLDKELRLNDDGEFKETVSHIPTLKKSLFVLHRFSKINSKKFKRDQLWNDIKNCERVRNTIIHPKRVDIDKFNVKQAQIMRESVINFIRKTNKAVFGKNIPIN